MALYWNWNWYASNGQSNYLQHSAMHVLKCWYQRQTAKDQRQLASRNKQVNIQIHFQQFHTLIRMYIPTAAYTYTHTYVLTHTQALVYRVEIGPVRIIRHLIDMWDKETYAWNAAANYRNGYRSTYCLRWCREGIGRHRRTRCCSTLLSSLLSPLLLLLLSPLPPLY